MKSIGARKRQQAFDVSIRNMADYIGEDNLEKEVIFPLDEQILTSPY